MIDIHPLTLHLFPPLVNYKPYWPLASYPHGDCLYLFAPILPEKTALASPYAAHIRLVKIVEHTPVPTYALPPLIKEV